MATHTSNNSRLSRFHFNSRSEDFDDFADDIVEVDGEVVNPETEEEAVELPDNQQSYQ